MEDLSRQRKKRSQKDYTLGFKLNLPTGIPFPTLQAIISATHPYI